MQYASRRADQDGVPVLLVSGDIELQSRQPLVDDLTAAAGDGREGGLVVVDLSAVGFCDSTGLHALSVAKDVAARHGARLALVPAERVDHLLQLTGLDTLFERFVDIAAAIHAGRP